MAGRGALEAKRMGSVPMRAGGTAGWYQGDEWRRGRHGIALSTRNISGTEIDICRPGTAQMLLSRKENAPEPRGRQNLDAEGKRR